jgi:hypothetical protein
VLFPPPLPLSMAVLWVGLEQPWFLIDPIQRKQLRKISLRELTVEGSGAKVERGHDGFCDNVAGKPGLGSECSQPVALAEFTETGRREPDVSTDLTALSEIPVGAVECAGCKANSGYSGDSGSIGNQGCSRDWMGRLMIFPAFYSRTSGWKDL